MLVAGEAALLGGEREIIGEAALGGREGKNGSIVNAGSSGGRFSTADDDATYICDEHVLSMVKVG